MYSKSIFTNAIVQDAMEDDKFVGNTNHHKYAILWATNFYKCINYILRNNDVKKIVREFKYTTYFVHKFIKYFFEHGKSARDLQRKTIKLYRGYDNGFRLTKELNDLGFIATSQQKRIAKKFAGEGGNIIRFNVKDLPDSVRYVVIDESLRDDLFEDEVLFLPGVIYINEKMQVDYKPNMKLIDIFMNQVAPLHKGGGGIKRESLVNLELKGKKIVWYRAIQGRQVEIINWHNIPQTDKKVYEFFRYTVNRLDSSYENMLKLIPEYVDLQNKRKKSGGDIRKLMSYKVFTAIYNHDTRQVETIRYGVFEEVFQEIFDTSRTSEVESEIVKFFSQWS
jgi:hypothetical protein